MQHDSEKQSDGSFDFEYFMQLNGLEHLDAPDILPDPTPEAEQAPVTNRNSPMPYEELLHIIKHLEAKGLVRGNLSLDLPRTSQEFMDALQKWRANPRQADPAYAAALNKVVYLFGYLDALCAMSYMQVEHCLSGIDSLIWVYNFWRDKLVPFGFDSANLDYWDRPHIGYRGVLMLPESEDDAAGGFLPSESDGPDTLGYDRADPPPDDLV